MPTTHTSPFRQVRPAVLSVALVAALGGCEGALYAPAGAPVSCELPSPGRAPMRRLTPFELDRSLDVLFGGSFDAAERLLPQERVGGFTTSVDVGAISTLGVEQYQSVAEDVAASVVTSLPELMGCDPTTAEDACVESFVNDFGGRAFRRPLENGERTRLLAFYRDARATESVAESVTRLVEVVLQSPRFLYRIELPAESTAVGSIRPLDGYEMASRMAFLVWAATPDEALLEAAASGALDTPEGRAAELERLLDHPRAADVITRFVDEWMELERLETLTKDEDAYPSYEASLAPLFREETHRFIAAAWEEDGVSLPTLLGADWSVRNATLASFYGEPGPSGAGWERVSLPAYRRGLLGHASFLASYAKPADTSPTRRGMFVRGRLLCGVVDSPPMDVETEVPDVDPTLTLRERLAEHRSNPSCGSCHRLMDPMGLGFEAFDGIGLHRTMERGHPIDATGTIVEADIEGDFDGAIELTERLSMSRDVERCFAQQYFRYAMGRNEDFDTDSCALADMGRAFRRGERSLRDLLHGLVASPSFTHIVNLEASGVGGGT